MEIPLKDVYKHLDEVIADKFKKERKQARKFISSAVSDIKSMKGTLKDLDKGVASSVEEDEESPTELFKKAMVSEFDEFNPSEDDEIDYERLKSIVDFWPDFKKQYHHHGKGCYGGEYNTFLMGLEMQIDKIMKSNEKLEKFLENKYEPVQDAEEIKDDLDELGEIHQKHLKEKDGIDPLREKLLECETALKESEEELARLEEDESFSKTTEILKKQGNIKQKILSKLSKIKKTVKKFMNLVEHDDFRTSIPKDDIAEYFDNLFDMLIEEGPEYPKFKTILENLVTCLNKEIQMKDNKKEKALAAIIAIKDEDSLKKLIQTYLDYKEEEDALSKSMEGKGILEDIEKYKNQVYHLTNEKEKIESDISREEKNLQNTVEEESTLKNSIENEISELSGEEFSIILD
ncbi:MAG: hypothetical protein ACFFCS_08675 [Candidatus Hodarchaeota archaeon]